MHGECGLVQDISGGIDSNKIMHDRIIATRKKQSSHFTLHILSSRSAVTCPRDADDDVARLLWERGWRANQGRLGVGGAWMR